MRRLFILTAIAAAVSAPAYSVTLKKDMPVCITEDLYQQMVVAAFKKDMDALTYLAANGCTISDKPLKVTVLDLSTWGSLAHIRVYRGKYAAEVWTARESLDGYDPLNP
jgi:hypothetical protein